MDDPLTRSDDGASKSAQRYDEVPYQSHPNSLLDPARLGAVAALWGHVPANPTTARVLEIGCATAGHSIALAARYPHASFIGIDVSGVQIEAGRKRIERLGLTNIALHTKSVTDLDAADGLFDYIICHGVFSWVSDNIRRSILDQCKALLSPAGLALISFNVLPGWRLLQVIRDTALLHARRFDGPEDKAREMRALFEALSRFTKEGATYGSVWRQELAHLTPEPDYYLLHELLEDHNLPMTFGSFNNLVTDHGLHYLADANFLSGIPENAGADKGAFIRTMAEGRRELREQYTDIVTGRTFRSAMVVGVPPPEVEADAHLDRLAAMHFVAPPDVVLTSNDAGKPILKFAKAGELEIEDDDLERAIRLLLDRRPSTSCVADLLPAGATEEEADDILECAKKLVCMGVVDVSMSPINCPVWPRDKPKAWALARSDAVAGATYTSTLLQEPIKLTERSRFLLGLADGQRTLTEIADALFGIVTGGGATISENGQPITDPARLRAIVSKAVSDEFENFARQGLLTE